VIGDRHRPSGNDFRLLCNTDVARLRFGGRKDVLLRDPAPLRAAGYFRAPSSRREQPYDNQEQHEGEDFPEQQRVAFG
jgi:hypothetical protein